MSIRKDGPPTEPTFVFSSVLADGSLTIAPITFGALRHYQVEAVMESYAYLQGRKTEDGWTYKKHDLLFKLLDWPAWRYLDSGIFSMMRKAGTHRVQTGTRAQGDFMQLSKDLLRGYKRYLRRHRDWWDYAVEVDTDNIPDVGPRFTLFAREQLHEILGDKLLPVWHLKSEQVFKSNTTTLRAWKRLIRDFPYVAIGGDKGRDVRLYKHMVDLAHANGTMVHGLGSTSRADFQEIGWDTGDSTNWKAGARYGRYTDLVYAKSARMDPRALAIAMRAEVHMDAHDVDKLSLLDKGNVGPKFKFGISRELERQTLVRETIHAWQSAKAAREGMQLRKGGPGPGRSGAAS